MLVLALVGVLAAAGSGLQDTPPPARGGSDGQRDAARGGDRLTIAWGDAPHSLDPAFAVDRTAENLVLNIFDPLVRLGPHLEPVPSLASRWETSGDGRRITFVLRRDATWTNGQAVTAADFEYAWKRVLAPETRSPTASRLFPIARAAAYHACSGDDCARLAKAVGVRAVGEHRLVVTLARPRAWFVGELADPAFLPVRHETVERFRSRWTDPENIVANGPFSLAALDEDSVSLVRNPTWRDAARVTLARVDGRFVHGAAARLQAFDAGIAMVLDGTGLPGDELPSLREREEYETYPALGAYLYAFNLRTIEDVHQRRAMALAIDREGIAANVLGADVTPATRFLPLGIPDAQKQPPQSPWLPPGGDLDAARRELAQARVVKRRVTLLHVDAGRNGDIANAVRGAWRALGIDTAIRARDPERYLDFRGPLGADSVDVYQLEVRYRYPDAFAALDDWTCGAERNKTNFCSASYDALVQRARREPDLAARERLYASAEQILSGEQGAFPAVPIFWPTYENLESLKVRASFSIDPLGRIDLSLVHLRS